MRIHKEGYQIISVTFGILLFVNLLASWIWGPMPKLQSILAGTSLLFFIFVVRFFRHPIRELQGGENTVISPADGRVVVIEEIEDTEYFHDRRLQVSIFMSAFNVHVNWLPVSGTVKYFRYHPGRYIVAFNPKSSELNERTTTVIQQPDKTEIMVRQVAGAVARRIVTYPKTQGHSVVKGHQLGFIKFGSRVDILLPIDAKIRVSLHQKVTGLHSIIADLT
jgi:phosphatidylserine decarboxylase